MKNLRKQALNEDTYKVKIILSDGLLNEDFLNEKKSSNWEHDKILSAVRLKIHGLNQLKGIEIELNKIDHDLLIDYIHFDEITVKEGIELVNKIQNSLWLGDPSIDNYNFNLLSKLRKQLEQLKKLGIRKLQSYDDRCLENDNSGIDWV